MMRKIGLVVATIFVVAACKQKPVGTPVDQILEIGAQAEKELGEIAAKQTESKDLSEIVELGKQEKAVRDTATSRINALLGGKGGRLAVAVGPCTDTLPVNFAHGSIGIPDFYKGEFRINLQIAGTGKRPLPQGTYFQLTALDAQGKTLFAKEANMVDSAKIGDTLYAGGMFRAAEIKGLAAVAAK